MVIIFDNSILVSIIAINLTLIGLTSLAESKRVIGIDYGKFLVNEFIFFRFLGVKVKFRLKYWLLSFILLNGFAIISLFVLGDNEVIVLINGAVLSLCLITLLLYFCFYIFTFIFLTSTKESSSKYTFLQ